MRYSLAAIAPALLASSQLAAASDCFNFAIGPAGLCNVDPSEGASFEAFIVQDQANSSCDSSGNFAMAINYADVQGNQHRQAALATTSVNSSFVGTMPFNFNVALASIGTGTPVTITVTASGTGTPLHTTYTWNMAHTNTISYVVSTTTIGEFATTTTTTIPNTNVKTTTIVNTALPIVTYNGTAVKTVQAVRKTVTSTVTPSPLAATLHKYAKVRTTLECAAPATVLKVRQARAFTASYSVPYCAAVATQTITTSVATATTTASFTDTVTVLSDVYSTATVTIAPTTCSKCKTTTVTTLPAQADFTSWIKQRRSSSTTTITSTYVVYNKPTGTDLKQCKANISSPSPTDRITMIATPTTTKSVKAAATTTAK